MRTVISILDLFVVCLLGGVVVVVVIFFWVAALLFVVWATIAEWLLTKRSRK